MSSFVGVHVKIRRYWWDHYGTILVLYMANVSFSLSCMQKNMSGYKKRGFVFGHGRGGEVCVVCVGVFKH